TTLIDRHIDEHGALLHFFQHGARHELWRAGSGNYYGADYDVARQNFFFDRLHRRSERPDAAFEQFVELAQTRQRLVDDRHITAKPGRHPRSMRTDDPAAEYNDLRRSDAGHAAQQHAATAGWATQSQCSSFDRKPPGDFAHWCRQRRATIRVRHGFVSDCGRTRLHKADGLRRVGRQMQVSKKNLLRLQPLPLGWLRFLHLHDHLIFGKDVAGRRYDAGARLRVDFVFGENTVSRTCLNDHLMTVRHELAHRTRH